jgi:hypothetical protein
VLRSSSQPESGEEGEGSGSTEKRMTAPQPPLLPPIAKGEEERTYPIDFPSYGLLGISGVVAIAFIGSIFEVSGPNPVVR